MTPPNRNRELSIHMRIGDIEYALACRDQPESKIIDLEFELSDLEAELRTIELERF